MALWMADFSDSLSFGAWFVFIAWCVHAFVSRMKDLWGDLWWLQSCPRAEMLRNYYKGTFWGRWIVQA